MTVPEPAAPLLPVRAQPLIAAGVVVGLAAIAVWAMGIGWFDSRAVHHDTPPAAVAAFTVNINSAGVVELSQLPGLGPATAQRIVDQRREHGPFASLEALLDVPGIGPRTLEELRPHLRPIRSPEAAR